MFGNVVYLPPSDPRPGCVRAIESRVGACLSPRIDWALEEVRYAGRVFDLNSPIIVTLSVDSESGAWVCENQALSILSFGSDVARAVHSFSEDFEMLWDVIAQSPDDSLTADAEHFKREMLSLVKKVAKS